mmetsp:Transcript_29775/g.50001  ORF Transcript_29775/g.50001 Transcript_29775/m.50001 type:complete len:198 (-) Transcript_29775:288-881(-)|eukprot:CAMPEP_0198228924 /NCGR_PEP_ID=MMETSP1445-20131203/113853_1 /TAXON_ID=36898 /ORGANISM="Pyramimonas sp., Strain CCMP2087" /LENGTH=197 /DNA_ID=CAMNT_0043909361 /DNA_START=1065 /DNA_END=1658 /DNA_ORIENTATION=+
MPGDSQPIFYGVVASQLVTLVAYVVVTVGVGLLQVRANDLPLWRGQSADQRAATVPVYNDVFFKTQYIIPYPDDAAYQFQYQWWIVEFELFVFLLTAPCVLFPRFIERVRPMALTFLAAALVLVMDNINSVIFLRRSELAKAVFGEQRIEITLAGLLLVAIANFMTIISYGLYKEIPAEREAKDGTVWTAGVSQMSL